MSRLRRWKYNRRPLVVGIFAATSRIPMIGLAVDYCTKGRQDRRKPR